MAIGKRTAKAKPTKKPNKKLKSAAQRKKAPPLKTKAIPQNHAKKSTSVKKTKKTMLLPKKPASKLISVLEDSIKKPIIKKDNLIPKPNPAFLTKE